MRLIYSGPHPEVVIDELDQEQVIVAGEPVNVPDELGARLLEQDTWADAPDDQSKVSPTAKAAEKAKADAEAAKAAQDAENATKGNS